MSETDPQVEPQMAATCPKCGHEQVAPAPCHRCGFDFERHEAPLGGGEPPPQALLDQWDQLHAQLDDTEAHHAFIQACAIADQLEFAGRSYQRLDPLGRDERISAYRQRVLNAALARLAPTATQRDPDRDRLRVLLLLLFGALILLAFTAGIYYAGQAMERRWIP